MALRHASRLHGELAATVVRDSAAAVQQELLACYALIERLGRGVVYYGSARLKAASPHWDRARHLGADVARLLGCTTWSGGGPGMMEAATLGNPPLLCLFTPLGCSGPFAVHWTPTCQFEMLDTNACYRKVGMPRKTWEARQSGTWSF